MSLTKRLLRRDDLSSPAIKRFSCGELPRDVEINDYLRGDAVDDVENGKVFVWLYYDDAEELVGYSSLGKTAWRYPKPKSEKIPLQIIPFLAVATLQQGARHSYAILDDTIAEAIDRKEEVSDLLGLFVQVEHHRAIKIYRSRGFEAYSKPQERDGDQYQRMLLKLPEP